MQLPSNCLYGVRTARCLENLSFSGSRMADYPELIRSLAQVKRACAQANFEAGLLKADIKDLILQVCLQIENGELDNQFPVDMLHGGGYIAFNTNMNEVIANVANSKVGGAVGDYKPVSPKECVNCSQSTADSCHTAVRVAIISIAEQLDSALKNLIDVLANHARQYASVTTIARTCLQDAMPVSLGETFGAWAAFLERRRAAFLSSINEIHKINLGGTVIGCGTGSTEQYRSRIVAALKSATGRNVTHRENLYDAAQNMDDLGAVSAQLRLLAQGLIKIAKDVRLMSSGPDCGFGELALPAVQEGSSFFSGKVNPVVPETLIQACIQVIGNDHSVGAAIEHGELNLNIFEGVACKNILDSEKMLARAIGLFTEKCIEGMSPRQEECAAHVDALRAREAGKGSVIGLVEIARG